MKEEERDRARRDAEAYAVMATDPVWGWAMGLVLMVVPPGFILAWAWWPPVFN